MFIKINVVIFIIIIIIIFQYIDTLSTLSEHRSAFNTFKTSEQSVLKSDAAELSVTCRNRRHDGRTHTGLSLWGGLS